MVDAFRNGAINASEAQTRMVVNRKEREAFFDQVLSDDDVDDRDEAMRIQAEWFESVSVKKMGTTGFFV